MLSQLVGVKSAHIVPDKILLLEIYFCLHYKNTEKSKLHKNTIKNHYPQKLIFANESTTFPAFSARKLVDFLNKFDEFSSKNYKNYNTKQQKNKLTFWLFSGSKVTQFAEYFYRKLC